MQNTYTKDLVNHTQYQLLPLFQTLMIKYFQHLPNSEQNVKTQANILNSVLKDMFDGELIDGFYMCLCDTQLYNILCNLKNETSKQVVSKCFKHITTFHKHILMEKNDLNQVQYAAWYEETLFASKKIQEDEAQDLVQKLKQLLCMYRDTLK